jgi:tryptophan synthase alpha chain
MAGEGFPEAAAAAVQGGATMVEIGIPYSDPLADGPVIQRAAQAALAAGMTTRRCLEIMAAARRRLGPGLPLVPMTYAAIVERHGTEAFCAQAAAAGPYRPGL